MSAIGGLLNLDGAPVDGAALARLSQRLAARGPEGEGAWQQGAIGLLHRYLRLTPESLTETQPYTTPDGALTITADVRLDNRPALCAALGRREEGQPDCALILAAYERWGEGCAEHLLGDFAFALWDARTRRLFCARDHLGVRPLAYYATQDRLAFASEVNALLALPEIPRAVNEVRIAAFLTAVPDPDHSFYRDIHYLPPGHTLTAAPGEGVRLRQYWDLSAPRETRQPNTAAYVEAFRDLLTDAVGCRLRSAYPVGVMLSGGLDSSSVACLAAPPLAARGQPLRTLSIIYDEVPEADERAYMALVLAVLGPGAVGRHQQVLGDPVSMVTGMTDLMARLGEPFFVVNMPLQWQCYAAARQDGTRVLLDGNLGDTVVSLGELRLAELVGAGRWRTAVREANLLAAGWPNPSRGARQLLWHQGLKPWLPPAVLRGLSWLRGSRPQGAGDARPAWAQASPVLPAFAARIDHAPRLQALQAGRGQAYRSVRQHSLGGIGRDRHVLGPFNLMAARVGMEHRHPFFDKRMVEFCLGLPAEQRLHDGWTRAIERDAMAGILPEAIARRRYKASGVPAASRALLSRDLPALGRLIDGLEDTPAAAWVDPTVVQHDLATLQTAAARGDYENSGHRLPMMRLWRVLVLLLWLRQGDQPSA